MRYLLILSVGALALVAFVRDHQLKAERDTAARSVRMEALQRDAARLAEQHRAEFERLAAERVARDSIERATREYRADVDRIREQERAEL